MTGSPTRDLPAPLAKRFIGPDDIARLLDKPCKRHAGMRPNDPESQLCQADHAGCDRWATYRARRWMRRVSLGHMQGSRLKCTLRQLLDLPGIGEHVLAKLNDDELETMLG